MDNIPLLKRLNTEKEQNSNSKCKFYFEKTTAKDIYHTKEIIKLMEDTKIKKLQIYNDNSINKFVHSINKIHFTHWRTYNFPYYSKITYAQK